MRSSGLLEMNKFQIKWCPWEPCGVELKAEDVTLGYGGVRITCPFCTGVYLIHEVKAPLSIEDVGKKWNGLPLTDTRAVKLAKRKEGRKKK
jgi:hypothetical protein